MTHATRAPTAAIIVIGDEVLSGKVKEQNGRFLVRELRALGVAERRIEVIPDVREEIAAAVRAASANFDHVFTSGGIGPTHDDVTIAAIAAAFAVPVVRHPVLAAYHGQSGAVTVVQRTSADLKLNPSMHLVALDGVFTAGPSGKPVFRALPRVDLRVPQRDQDRVRQRLDLGIRVLGAQEEQVQIGIGHQFATAKASGRKHGDPRRIADSGP
jgi:molybdenum cofactor synthesis domain-containing protein